MAKLSEKLESEIAKDLVAACYNRAMAKLSEKHPREAEIAQQLLLSYRNRDVVKSITLSGERADDLEMKICEALVEERARARSEV